MQPEITVSFDERGQTTIKPAGVRSIVQRIDTAAVYG